MSKFRKVLIGTALATTLIASPVLAGKLGLGREALPEEIAAWDIDVRPDGLGLPEGSGDVATGEEVFSEKCAVCHGEFGEAVGRWPVLAGGRGTLDREDPVKTIGSYWPYLSTAWDYVNRAMPFGNAQSLEVDEVYAIVAYLLYVNDLVEDDFTLSKENFLEVAMPNVGGFIMDDRDTTEVVAFSQEPCMENCKDSVEITMHASVVDVTPEETAAKTAAVAAEAAPAAEPATAEPAAAEPTAEATTIAPELVAAGEKVFKKCAACHKVGEGAKNGTGPMLTAVIGHVAGTTEGFKYSKTMIEAGEGGLIWDAEKLGQFLENPKAFLPKNKMTFAGLKKPEEREAVIAYLSSIGK